MEGVCTIVCGTREYLSILQALQSLAGDSIRIAGEAGNWESIEVVLSSSKLRFNSLVYQQPGDRFSKSVLGMYNYFKDVPGEDKERVLGSIARAEMLIGIAAEPGFDEEQQLPIISKVAEEAGGIIFTGDELVDANGTVLLKRGMSA